MKKVIYPTDRQLAFNVDRNGFIVTPIFENASDLKKPLLRDSQILRKTYRMVRDVLAGTVVSEELEKRKFTAYLTVLKLSEKEDESWAIDNEFIVATDKLSALFKILSKENLKYFQLNNGKMKVSVTKKRLDTDVRIATFEITRDCQRITCEIKDLQTLAEAYGQEYSPF